MYWLLAGNSIFTLALSLSPWPRSPNCAIIFCTCYLNLVRAENLWRNQVDWPCGSHSFFLMRIWIHHWYQDLYAIPATHFSMLATSSTLFNSWFDFSLSTIWISNSGPEQTDFGPTSTGLQLGRPQIHSYQDGKSHLVAYHWSWFI